MSFLAPLAISGIGALLSGGGGGSNADLHQQQSAGSNLLNSGASLIGSSAAPVSHGLSTLSAAGGDIGQANSFFQRLLGSRSDEMNALSPEIAAVTSQYDASRRMRGNLAPRGGGATAANTGAQFKEIGDIGNILANGRTDAAKGLLSGAGALAGVGGSEAGIGLNQLSSGLNAEGNAAGVYGNAQKTVEEQQSSLGEGLGGLLGQMFPDAAKDAGKSITGILSRLFGGG